MSEEELLRREIAELHAQLNKEKAKHAELVEMIEKLRVDFGFSIYDVMVDKFSESFEDLLKNMASKENFEFLGKEYEPKKYVVRATVSQAKQIEASFGRYMIFHRTL